MKKGYKLTAAILSLMLLGGCSISGKDIEGIKESAKEAVESGFKEGKEAVESGWNEHKGDLDGILSKDKFFEVTKIDPDEFKEFKDLDWEKFLNKYLLDEKDIKDIDIRIAQFLAGLKFALSQDLLDADLFGQGTFGKFFP